MYQPSPPVATTAEAQRASLRQQLQKISTQCTQCQRCVAECQFLKTYGDPKKIADGYNPNDNYCLNLPFECSLCDLCSAVCTEQLDLTTMFLEMRRETVDRGAADYPKHKGLHHE